MLFSMNNKKIAFFDAKPWEIEILKSNFEPSEIVFCSESVCALTPIEKNAEVAIISSFINSDLSRTVLESFPNLQYIATRSTGFDHIDIEYCKKKGIKVSNVPNYGKHTVAEHALTLLLCLAKRIPESRDRVMNGEFHPENLTGVDLYGKTIGILGTGNIGLSMIKMSLGIGMEVLAYDIKESPELSKNFSFKYVDIESVFKHSDFISIHLPYLKSTHHLINSETIMLMKDGVKIINTSRGAIIDTSALLKGLRSGKISGAGLDVLENEKDIDDEMSLFGSGNSMTIGEAELVIQNNILVKMPNVLITPHNAFNTTEALGRITSQTVMNIKSFLEGSLINPGF
jgi:D-lactate dehydrogenase